MAAITITLSEDRLQKLQNLAKQFNIPTEELLRVSFEEFVARPQEDFQKGSNMFWKHTRNYTSGCYNDALINRR
jgi:hypothetical protein